MALLDPREADKLAKICGLFGSDHDGERARAAAKLIKARPRQRAWTRVIEALAEQRASLEHRIWREDPEDIDIDDDVRIWGDLARALADFLEARRVA
jgi:hypothetical protein